MEEPHEGQTLQTFLLSHPKIQSIEKLDAPRQDKWWILAKKIDLEEVEDVLNNATKEFMEGNQPIHHRYTPPNEVPIRDTIHTEQVEQVNEYSNNLRKQIGNRPRLDGTHHIPPSTGRGRRSYLEVSVGSAREESSIPKKIVESGNNTGPTQYTVPSTLTDTQKQPQQFQKLIEAQEKRMAETMKTFQDMMQNMIEKVMTLVTTLISLVMGGTAMNMSTQQVGQPRESEQWFSEGTNKKKGSLQSTVATRLIS